MSKLVKAPNVDGDGIPDDIPNACSEPWGWTNGNGGQGNANGVCNGNGGGKAAQSGALRRAMKTPSGQQAHHLIPTDVLDNNVVQAALEAGFDFNGKANGLNVVAQSGSHPARTARIRSAFERFARNNPDYTPAQARSFAEGLVRREKADIIRKGLAKD